MAGRRFVAPRRDQYAAQETPVPHEAAPVLALTYPGVLRPVILQDAGEVLAGLAATLHGWSPQIGIAGRQDFARALTGVAGRLGSYGVTSAYLDAPMHGLPAASAVCGVIADLAQAYIDERPGILALHCGAVMIGGQLVVLTGQTRAGKSTLMSRLTAEPEMTVFCDDVLPVLPGGMAYGLGVAPRLRLPLPERASEVFRSHVALSAGVADARYAYLNAGTVAPHGTRAPLAALIVLTRDAVSPARLHEMPVSEAVQHLMARNMADPGDPQAHLDRLNAVAQGLLCLRLVYSDLEDAVILLRAQFAGKGVDIAPSLPPGQGVEPVGLVPVDLAQVWRRDPMIGLRRVGEEVYLWHAAQRAFVHLNPVATAVWLLLEEPMRGNEVVAILQEAFVAVPPEVIAQDVAGLLAGLAGQEMVEGVGEA